MSKHHPLDRFAGSWALVTGSAREQGLGFAFARQIASRKINLVLLDIREEELQSRAAALRSQYGVDVRPITADLGDLSVYPTIMAALSDVSVDVLICDHMFTPGTPRRFWICHWMSTTR